MRARFMESTKLTGIVEEDHVARQFCRYVACVVCGAVEEDDDGACASCGTVLPSSEMFSDVEGRAPVYGYQFHRICSPFWRLERKLTEVASYFGVPQSDRFQAMSMLSKIFSKKVPCVGPNSIRTVGTVLWLQSQSSGSHALLLNEVATVVNATVEDMNKQARRLRLVLMQGNVKCPKAALRARLSSLSRRTLEHLDVSLTQFLAANMSTVSADAVKLEIQKYIDSTCDFVAIVSFDEGASPCSLAAAITFLSCSIAALNQQVYVSFARKAAVRKANQRKRSLRTTLLPLVRNPWGITMAQCAGVTGSHPETALFRLRRLEAAFDDCIARHFVVLFPSSSADCSDAPLVESQQQRVPNLDLPTMRTRSPDRSATAVASTPPILLYNRIPVVLQHLLFLSRSRCDAAAESTAHGPALDECPHAAAIQENAGYGEDSDGSDLDRFAALELAHLLVLLASYVGPSYILTPEQSRRKLACWEVVQGMMPAHKQRARHQSSRTASAAAASAAWQIE